MTQRLYYTDSYLERFRANLIDAADDGRRVYLDRTAFYPDSGGQPADTGELAGARVTAVVDEGERIAHVLDRPVHGTEIQGVIDWRRRFDHMQQHSGQHLLSAVLIELLGASTISFHLGEEASTIDLSVAALDPEQIRKAEQRANEIVFENRPLSVTFAQSNEDLELRKASDREGELRIVAIEGLDRSACGGTHVRSTGEIGPILIRKLEKIRVNVRLEFLCGGRAVRRARADYDVLSSAARAFSSQVDDVPALIAAQTQKLQEADKARRKLTSELARYEGKELYEQTAADSDGVRRLIRRGPLSDETRVLAQSFTSQPGAWFLGISEEPPSLLLAVSADSGVHAGNLLKQALTPHGGRGGGNAQLAQGSVPSCEALEAVVARLR